MPISVTCKCGQPLTLRDDAVGKTEQCPYCSLQFRVPSPQKPAPASAQPKPAPTPAMPFPAPGGSGSAPAAPGKPWEYKVLTQKDKWFSGKFDPEQLEAAMNAYAKQGWRVMAVTTASVPGFGGNRDELIVVLER
jgi:hypothetical protein